MNRDRCITLPAAAILLQHEEATMLTGTKTLKECFLEERNRTCHLESGMQLPISKESVLFLHEPGSEKNQVRA